MSRVPWKDFLLDALDEVAGEVFAQVAHLLNPDVDIVFVDTTSTYWELDIADELAELAEDAPDGRTSTTPQTTTAAQSKPNRAMTERIFGLAVAHWLRAARRCNAGDVDVAGVQQAWREFDAADNAPTR